MPLPYTALQVTDLLSSAYVSRLEIRAYSDVGRRARKWDRGFIAPINPESIKVAYKNTLAGQVGLNSTGASLSVASNQAEEISFKLVLTDSPVFHYSGRNTFTFLNNYEADNSHNIGFQLGSYLSNFNNQPEILSPEEIAEANRVQIGKLHDDRHMSLADTPLGARDGHVSVAIERFLNLTTQKTLKDGDKDAQNAYLGLVWGRVFNRPGELDAGKFKAKRKKIYPCYLDSVDINYTHFTRDGRVLRAELDCVFKEDSSDNG